MSEYMLMFSLGPVQPFIAQARKTRDLWLGSYLLAKLMEAAVEELKGDLVYPVHRTVDDKRGIPDIPNKFVAIFQSEDAAYEEVGQCKTRIEKRWEAIWSAVWQKIVAVYATDDTRRIWNRQTNPGTLFEMFWVIVAQGAREYQEWLTYTEKALEARKRLRDFVLEVEGEPGEKSTISGERAALRGEKADRKGVQDFWIRLTADRSISAHDISKDGSERLDAIDTVKRFATRSSSIPEMSFPSTSYIATASFIERLLVAPIDSGVLSQWRDKTRGELVELTRDAIRAVPYLWHILERQGLNEREWLLRRDGDLYFPETFVPRRLMQDYNIADMSEAVGVALNAKEALRVLFKVTDESGITRPTPYYALIQMDGDRMGFLLSQVEDKTKHVAISRALSTFSRELAPELIEDSYPGRLVYAGGDDVVALAPLARDIHINDEPVTVLDLVDRLRRIYHDTVQEPVSKEEFKGGVTASVGIAVAHHYTSLSYVRRTAKAAEDLAKKHYGRNALVITVLRRSGEQTRVGCHWFYEIIKDDKKKIIEPLPLFLAFYEQFKHDGLSPKCIHILLEETAVLVGLDREVQQSEVKRVLLRQRNEKVEDKFTNDEVVSKAQQLVELAEAMDNDESRPMGEKQHLSIELHADERRYGLVEVLGWLLVMAFLARKEPE